MMASPSSSDHRWSPPFEAEKEIWRAWMWRTSNAAVLREIASADWVYRPDVEAAIRELLREFNPVKCPPFEVCECLELVSNHEYQDEAGSDSCMMLAGSACIALESSGVGYLASGMPGRISQTTHAVLQRDRGSRLACAHLMAWAATRSPADSEIPQSYFAASVLCFAATERARNPKPIRSLKTPFESDEHVESLANDVERVFVAEADAMNDPALNARPESLEALDNVYGSSGHWSLCINTVLGECGQRLSNARRVLGRLRG